jgi:hypothetical protein
MGAAWKTIPLFTSSTFRDMLAERDKLNNVVFPFLLVPLGDHYGWVPGEGRIKAAAFKRAHDELAARVEAKKKEMTS